MIAGFVPVLLLALALALGARTGHPSRDPRSFFAARGQFGAILFFLLSVGETYSIGSVLGFPGGMVAKGPGLAVWFVGYILLAAPVGFLLYPLIWRAGQRSGAITLPALFRTHFGSPTLGRCVAVLLVLLMLPLGTMQIVGLDAVLTRLLPDGSKAGLNLLAAALALLFVALAGLRGAAFVSVLKDVLMLTAVLGVAAAALLAWPHHALMPVARAFQGEADVSPVRETLFALSTILIQSAGFCIAPQTVVSVFSARDPQTIRRAQLWLPLYMLLFPLLFAVACYALTHDVAREPADGVFLAVAATVLPDWAQGVVLAGVALTALVWLGAVCLALSAIVTRDLLPGLPPQRQRPVGVVVAASYLLLSVAGAAWHTVLIANLNTLFYLGLVQLLPGLAAILANRRLPAGGVLMSAFCGLALSLVLREASIGLYGVNPALPGLILNALLLGLVAARRSSA
ncbi:sodium:solute symporter family transporter [Acidomonas methanolica]|uniref:sodium:solute symporter family transporter n=1 Tax=Acidomonas methanolica TaxID=437 RepID=UPI00211A084B|nr:sodium:solute symporter [Acidomonas methanolica]MCQ9155917.1 sodium:solute symporter [Acidomonas methanolica]